MTGVLSSAPAAMDISASGFTAAARDLGEVAAILMGGSRPDPEMLSRLCLSLRMLQGFLLREASEQAGREAIADDAVLAAAIAQVCRPVSLPPLPYGRGGADVAA